MPTPGVSRTAVVLGHNSGCRVTVFAGRCPSRNAADPQLAFKPGRNLRCKTLSLLPTNDPCQNHQIRVHSEEREKFTLLPQTCPAVSAYMPSIQRRKAHSKTLRNITFHTIILSRFAAWSSIRFCPANQLFLSVAQGGFLPPVVGSGPFAGRSDIEVRMSFVKAKRRPVAIRRHDTAHVSVVQTNEHDLVILT
jgi:hypothetical protein